MHFQPLFEQKSAKIRIKSLTLPRPGVLSPPPWVLEVAEAAEGVARGLGGERGADARRPLGLSSIFLTPP